MTGIVFKLVFWFVAVGMVFGLGFIAGASFGTGTAEEEILEHLGTCLPATTSADLAPCVTGEAVQEQR